MVVEELVEGGLTRLAAFYYSQIPGRSARSARCAPATSASSRRSTPRGDQRRGRRDDRPDQGRRHPRSSPRAQAGFYRDSSAHRAVQPVRRPDRASPRRSSRTRPRPDDYLPWGAREGPARRASRPRSIAASFSGGHTTNWTFEQRQLRQREHLRRRTATSSRPTPCWCCGSRSATPATATRPATRCPETQFTGQGQAMLFHDGRLVRGTWTKDNLDAPIKLSHQGRRADRPRRPHLDRAGPATNGGNVTFTK